MTDTNTTETAAVEAPSPSAASYRKFASDHGIEVGSRGTIPSSVKAAYAKAGKRVQKRYL